ncbi:MAG TPA: hypothetical protein VF656_10755 [Pyrinomonadaceae bacterium]|jgi:hypothetical protein
MSNYLNSGILGDAAGVANKRGFRAIATQYLDTPAYNAKYFETFPTVWACAYAFSKMLATENDGGAAVGERLTAMENATEEWASLFLLHYFGDLHLVSYDIDKLQTEYDKDLWLALSGTYPASGDRAITSIKMLETDAHTVVGGYYPETVFFPGRGRSQWPRDKKLAAYLDGTRLSWAKCSALLLKGERERQEFHEHLERIARQHLPGKVFQDRLREFCALNFHGQINPSGTLPPDPADWEVPGNKQPEQIEFLRNYPLQKPNKKNGVIYYLVSGMPRHADWMTTSTAAGWPAPHQYVETGNNQITVDFAGKKLICKLSENDDIVHLHKLFLADSPHWCKVPKATDTHVSRIKPLHKIEMRDPVLTENDLAVCLAPLTGAFLEHFPEILRHLDQVHTTIDWQGTAIEWSLPLLGKEVKWLTRPTFARALSATSLRMWPPRVARQWHLYAAYGIGKKKDCGRWHLVDENGRPGQLIEIDDEEYFSVSQSTDGMANRPASLLLRDNENVERGVLFLADFQEQMTSGDGTATLSVDFGTSNTCLAYSDGDSKVLNFKLTPEILWGTRPELENPGFVPFEWGGHKGFFPTILLSRRSDENLTDDLHPDKVGLEHLFKVDIPGLHKNMEARLSEGTFNRVWKMHPNPKWETSGGKPWRTLFLELTMLYAHAELFFNKGVKLNKYVFTFPLAFSKDERKSYHSKVQAALRKVRQYCYGTNPTTDVFTYVETVDESTAIAESIGAAASTATMDVFIDIGGGTADIAVRHSKRFLVLDSIKVAGNTFFRFAEKNFKIDLRGASEFKKHLRRLLQDKNDDAEFKITNPDADFKLGVNYSVAINALDDEQFRDREMGILKKTMGTHSYQKYRTRLFFRHILAYGLLQACSAVVERKLKLTSGLKLVLGGNGWGLMVFADMPRSAKRLSEEATQILNLIKRELSPTLQEDERECLEMLKIFSLELLNEADLSKAKTDVALGALNANPVRQNGDQSATPYTGITLNKLQLNNFDALTHRWCERWGFDEFKQKYGFMDSLTEVAFESPENQEQPLDHVLSVFTCVGNMQTNKEDNMPADAWTNINGKLIDSISDLRGDRIEQSPINYFVSNILYPQNSTHDVLDILARKNGQYRNNSDEE